MGAPFLEEANNVESPNSCAAVEVGLDEILSTLGGNSPSPCSHRAEVGPFYVIFDLNRILITTHFNKSSCTVILRPGLKEFLEKCLTQFQVYIWSTT
jgi:hypothetical protein